MRRKGERRQLRRLLTEVAAGVLLSLLSALPGSNPALSAEPGGEKPVVTVGLVDTFSPEFYIHVYSPTLDRLIETLPQYRFRFVELDWRHVSEDIARLRPAFLVTSASDFVSLIESSGAHQIAARRPKKSSDVARTDSSLFIVRESSSLRTLADAAGSRAAVTSKKSFDGWLIAAGEIARLTGSPDTFFSSVVETRYGIPDPALLVRMGIADVGVLGTCEYEALLSTGQIESGEFRILDEKPADGGCRRSTERYPGVVFSSLPGVSGDITRDVTVALLTMPAETLDFSWTIVNDFLPTYALLKTLKIGPYAPVPLSAAELWKAYRTEILLMLALLTAVVFHIVTINLLVRKRTQELSESLAETRHFYREAQESRQKLLTLERMSIVSQLGSMFAHEIKQPIMNIALYAGALRLLLRKEGTLSERAGTLLDRVSAEVDRSSDIVEHVRGYAKLHSSKRVRCDLAEEAERCLRTLNAGVPVAFEAEGPAYVRADPFELQFIIANFVKNARSAVEQTADPRIVMRIRRDDPHVVLTVSDNGPPISDEAFARLGRVGRSVKTDGLGFGLAIAGTLAEKSGGHIAFERLSGGGLAASLVLKRDGEVAGPDCVSEKTNEEMG